jgi:hypothetical protein
MVPGQDGHVLGAPHVVEEVLELGQGRSGRFQRLGALPFGHDGNSVVLEKGVQACCSYCESRRPRFIFFYACSKLTTLRAVSSVG